MNITQAITLDLAKSSAPVCICAKQGDEKSRKVQITLVHDGDPYTPPSGASAVFRAQKPDGTMVLNSAVAAPDGTVTVELTRQTLAVAGSVTADVYLTDSAGAVLSSASFVIHVEPAPSGVQTDSENEFLHLSALVGRAEQAAVRAEGAVQDATHPQKRNNPHGVTAAQVGAATSAALNAHTANTSNPHGVTAAQAGAAPAGYVLSTLTVETDAQIDQAIRQIINEQSFAEHSIRFYYLKCTTTSLALGGGYWLLELNKMSANYGTVVARSYVGSDGVREMKRVWSGAVLQPWEWDNPPMSAGVEYRTTQRYLGKPVYTKLVELGTLPGVAGSKRIDHGAAANQIIRVTGASSDGHAIPYRYGPEAPMIWIGATETQVVVITANRSDADYSKLTGTAQIWYTK